MKLIVFSKPLCGACGLLKAALRARGLPFTDLDGNRSEGLTFMRTHGMFPAYFPAMCIDGRLYQYISLFDEKGNLPDLGPILEGQA